MNKLFIAFLLIVLLSGFAAAKDVAYITKNAASSAVVSVLNEMNYTYDIIYDSRISYTNFSNYAMILTQGDLANKLLIPFSSKNSLFIVDSSTQNVVSVVWPGASLSSSQTVFSNFQQLGTPFTEGFSAINFQAYSSTGQIYYLRTKPGYVNNVANKLGSTIAYAVVAYSNVLNVRDVYFGFSDGSYWTEDTRKLLKNSIKWARMGADYDRDGYYSDVDCNDNNASINPGAIEIPYNGIDENCDGYDLLDVDNDGYCKSGHIIQSKAKQCPKETGSAGTDCNDNNSSINPGAIETIGGGDKNCMAESPIFAGTIRNFSWNEDEGLTNAINLSDYFKTYDNDNLIYSVYQKYGNISATISNGIVSFGSGKDWNGNGWIIFKAANSAGESLSNNISIQVIPVNDAPVLAPISNIFSIEGRQIRITANATDIDSVNLTYSINDTRFISFGNAFTWNTSRSDRGTHYVLITVSDGFMQDSKEVTIKILQRLVINEFVSNPSSGSEWVEIYNPQNENASLTGCYLEDASYNHVQLMGTIPANGFYVKEMANILDDGGDTIRLYCTEMVDSVVYGSGNVSAPPIGKSAGRIYDGLDTDSASDWKIYDLPTKGVSNSADMIPPIVKLNSPANDSVFNISYVLFNYTATDNLALSLNCSFYSDVNNTIGRMDKLASDIVNNGSMKNFWANNAENGNYKWQVKCSDGSNIGDSPVFQFRVNVPKAPVMQQISNITVNETAIVKIIVNATDSNGDNLTYSINDTRFTPAGNTFEWLTDYNSAGTYYFNVSVSDGLFTVSRIVKVSVLNTNRAPVMQEISDAFIDEDTNYTLELNASDADNDSLTFSVIQKNASRVDCVVSGKNLTLKPAKDWNGNASCTIRVSDGTLYDSKSVSIIVNPVNDAPVLALIANINVQETEIVRITAVATDVDSANLIYSINDIRFNSSGNVFTWLTDYNSAGIYYFNVSVSDGNLSDSRIAKVTVNDKNEPPRINPIENITINEDSVQITLNLLATDSDGTISRFEVSQKDASRVDCVISDSLLGIKPAKDWNGNASCRIRVYDNKNAYDETIAYIMVTPVNDAPEITDYSPKYNPVISPSGSQIFSINWKDIDSSQSEVIVKWYVNENFAGIGNSFAYVSDGNNKTIKVAVNDSEMGVEKLWDLSVSSIPVALSFNGETTNFSSSNLSNINLVLEKTGFGKIEIPNVDLGNGIDFDNYADIKTGLAALDTNYFSKLIGKVAKITLTGLGFGKMPSIYYNDGFTLDRNMITALCPETLCQNSSYSNGTLVFYSHFTSFKAGDTLTCSQLGGNICKSGEVCQGSLLNAVEDKCCSSTCAPAFSDVRVCKKTSNKISVEIKNPGEDAKFGPGGIIRVKIRVENNADEDISEDISAVLYDKTADTNVYDKESSIDVDSGKKKDIEFELKVPNDISMDDEFAVYVIAEGDYCNQNYVNIKIERNKHDVAISSFEIPEVVNCNEQVEARVRLENIGKNREDITLEIKNTKLEISEIREISLKKAEDDGNKAVRDILLNIPDYAVEGSYIAEARISYSGEEKIERREIYVRCDKTAERLSSESGVLKLSGSASQIQIEKKNILDRINELDQQSFILILADIFILLAIILIIAFLIMRKR